MQIVKQKQEVIFNVANGMKHLLKKFETEGDDLSILANLEFMKEEK